MPQLLEAVKYIAAHWDTLILAFIGLFNAMIVIAMMIPGEQPDKFLQSVVDFLTKFSRKPPMYPNASNPTDEK